MSQSRRDIESRRRETLGEYRILDTAPEPVFDELVELVAQSCQVPMAILSLMDADRQWFKASVGLEVVETPRRIAFCNQVIESGEAMAINDAEADARYRDNPLVTGSPHIRFCAGEPLRAPDGSCIGSLAVMDTEPRTLKPDQVRSLKAFAKLAMHTLELRMTRLALEDSLAEQGILQSRVTESRQAVDRAHEMLNFHFESMPVALVQFDDMSRVTRGSAQAEAMFGWAEHEVIGKSLKELNFIHPEDQERVDVARVELLETGADASTTVVNRNLTRSGETRLCEWHNSARFDQDGRLLSILSFANDITDRDRTEEALRLSEERYRHAAEASQAALWDYDMLTGKLTFSEVFRDMLGYECFEDMPDTLEAYMELMHPDDRDQVSGAAQRLVAGETGDRGSAEFRLLTQSGEYRWVQSNSKVIRDAEGKAVRRLGSTVDIHERKVAEEQLKEQAELLDKARDAIIVTQLEGKVTFWNQGAARVYGWTSSEMLGVPIFERIHVSKDAWLQETQRLLDSGGWDGQLNHLRKDGERRKLQSHLTLVRDADDQPRSILAINTDVTEKVALEEQLRHAQRLESIGKLTGGVAHDFNNLLTVIMGNAELLNESLDDNPVLRSFAEMTLSAAHRGAELTNQLLAFARRQSLEPRCVDVFKLVDGMKPMLQRSIPEHVEIDIHSESSLWHAEIDPAQLESAVLNLSLNARDAMSEGGHLIITLRNKVLDKAYAANHPEVDPGQYVEVAVTDNGRGIKPELRQHLFEPFFTTKEKGKGTGLGLPMVYGFIKQSRGHIRVYSEPGVGTTVRMYLPRAAGDAEPDQDAVCSDDAPRGSERVLLVEDDELVLDHVSRLLEQLGYQVDTASDGENALQQLKVEPSFDLLFTDVIMPGQLKGPDLANEVRRINPEIRILFTSGYTQDVITPEMESEDGFHLLEKPYRKAELARKLREVFNR